MLNCSAETWTLTSHCDTAAQKDPASVLQPASSVKSGVCQWDKGWTWFKPIVCHINVWLSCSVSRADDEGTFCGSVRRLINKPTNRWTDILESAITPKEGVSEVSKTDRNEFYNKYSGMIHQSSFAVIYWSFLSLSSSSLSPPPSSHTPANSICTWQHVSLPQRRKSGSAATRGVQQPCKRCVELSKAAPSGDKFGKSSEDTRS